MQPFALLNREYYGNSVREWITAFAVLACVFVGLVVARHLLRQRLRRDAGDGPVPLVAADFANRTRIFFFFALAVAAGSLELGLPVAWRQGIGTFMFCALLLQIAIWGDGLVNYVLHGYIARQAVHAPDSASVAGNSATAGAIGAVAKVALWTVVGIVALDGFGVRVTTLIAGLGITGIAIALALQSILGDAFAAVSIVLDKPFVVGDDIGFDTARGTVEHIGLKTTRVRAATGEMVVIANAELLKARVRNYSQIRERTLIFTLVLDQTTPPDVLARVPELIREIVSTQSDTRFTRSHVTLPTDRGIAVETAFTVTTPDNIRFLEVQQATTLGLLRSLEGARIKLAAPLGTAVVMATAAPTRPA